MQITTDDLSGTVYIPDTSALIENPDALDRLLMDGNIVVLVHKVIEELGRLQASRSKSDGVRHAARNVTRKMLEYYHADRLNYAVLGTPNRLEYDQGFFVKNGDGSADLKPIAHLYKTQVYEMARHLGIPEEICRRPPTTDTYSMAQSQEEFYFSVPYQKMDLCLYGLNHGVAAAEVAEAVDLTEEQVERVYADIIAKRKATRYQHLPPLLAEPVGEAGFGKPA